jgi:protein TonB
VNPIYPVEALRKKIEGQVLVEVVTNRKGEVLSATVITGPLLLREAAIEAVKQWKHEPYQGNNKPLKRIFTISISFEIY